MRNLRRALVLCTMLMTATTAQADKLSLAALSDYLNAMQTATADFTQINDDGTISTGRILIKRPGRIRFEYAPPDQSLVLASQSQVAVFDAKSNEPPDKFPLTRTPLYLILAKDVNLGAARMVKAHDYDGTGTIVTAQDPAHPEYGHIQMVFTDNPVQLRQWIVTDGSGQQTTVILGALTEGTSIATSIFDIAAEEKARGF